MNKEAIVDQVAARAHTTKGQTAVIITSCLETIMQAVSEGDTVKLRRLGQLLRRYNVDLIDIRASQYNGATLKGAS